MIRSNKSGKRHSKETNVSSKKLITILFMLILLVLIAVWIYSRSSNKENIEDTGQIVEITENQYVETLATGTKINISDDFKEEKTYESLKFSNMQFTEENGISNLLADVTNTSDKKHEIEKIKIILLDDKDEVVTEVTAIIGEIESNETIQLNANVTADVVNVKDFKIESAE